MKRKYIVIFLVLAAVFAVLIYSIRDLREPESCSLCATFPCHAPCIVNLSTGEIGEIRIYQPHFSKVAEIAEEQAGGYFCFLYCAGLQGYCLGAQSATIYVPQEAGGLQVKHFCNSCRKLLAPYANSGFVIADLREPKSPTLYPIEVCSGISMRCYIIDISYSEEKEQYEILVTGTYNMEK